MESDISGSTTEPITIDENGTESTNVDGLNGTDGEGDDSEMRPMEMSDNNNRMVNKLWRLPDCGKISNPYFNGFKQGENNEPKCIRIGCCNLAVENSDWDYEYCSAICAVEHCKTAFTNWVATRQAESDGTGGQATPQLVTTIN
ncbi:uncharacterized protein LOC128387735 [Panonychus citri]|uniref:uncharacterized protein LOC128387735 n=1 Tax=Panonychus citri TaxID=50023 RepID=UPI0023078B73|nr:uncharacterized protein LOC128387735 [Panonychus citri]